MKMIELGGIYVDPKTVEAVTGSLRGSSESYIFLKNGKMLECQLKAKQVAEQIERANEDEG